MSDQHESWGFMGPQLSIGVFSHNHERFIEEALDSIDFSGSHEVLPTDDGSTDSTREVMAAHLERPPLASACRSANLDPENRGFVKRLNDFLDLMQGEWFVLLSGDDRFTQGALDHLLQLAEVNPAADVIFSRFGRVDSEGRAIEDASADKRYADLGRSFKKPGNPFIDLMTSGSFIAGGCTLVRADFVRQHGIRFNGDLANAEDYDFWLQCAAAGASFLYTDRRCWDHRVLSTSKYHSAGPERIRSELTAIGRHRPGSPFRARVGGLTWGVQKWKGQYLTQGKGQRVGIREAASLLESSVAGIFLSLPLVAAQSLQRRARGWR